VSAETELSTLQTLAQALETHLGPQAVLADEPLARYTAFRIGGPADLLAVAEDIEALRQAVQLAWEHGVPCQVLGGGSNVLVSDGGIRGLVILNRARNVTIRPPVDLAKDRSEGWRVRADSGASLSTVARRCVTQGLAGLEWASGIPGTVGGAVVGNAGAWGGDVASALLQATVLELDGIVAPWSVAQFEYGYRTSTLKRKRSGTRREVVLDAEFALHSSQRDTLEARVRDIVERRKVSQPPGATCGSVFRNPPGDYAGRLIEAAGLKGKRSGGAEISTVHANFIVNRLNATAADVKTLIDLAQQTVQTSFGVELKLEIELLGDW
jgi:UDP-N-acetylmuramate dehydrogenase